MNNIQKDVDSYYTDKVKTYGATPKGVDWNGEQSQLLRFKQLSKIIKKDKFTIADIGCGYGRYVEYLEKNFQNFDYIGYDISYEMVKNANRHYKGMTFMNIRNMSDLAISDYSIASGVFNIKMQYSNEAWLSYVLETLEEINKKMTNGFAFNMLTKYSDKKFMQDNLYYADPLFIFDFCKRNFAKNVSLIHDYDLYEFTILVTKY